MGICKYKNKKHQPADVVLQNQPNTPTPDPLQDPFSHSLQRPFARQQHRTNYAANDTMYRLQSSGNSVADIVDFFVDSIPVLKRKIAGLLSYLPRSCTMREDTRSYTLPVTAKDSTEYLNHGEDMYQVSSLYYRPINSYVTDCRTDALTGGK
ncbi:hypothetical protein J6590_065711 [Homalodisca vitripennis]|nr:hypothetical protein J6590_065711 [Homalodisca vitripennis]